MQFRNWARHVRLTALGTLLCLLAAASFVEAKVGWYSPDFTARVELSSTKVRADDAPKMVVSAPSASIPTPSALPHGVLIGAIVILAALSLSTLAICDSGETSIAAASPGSFPPLYLRPPPRR